MFKRYLCDLTKLQLKKLLIFWTLCDLNVTPLSVTFDGNEGEMMAPRANTCASLLTLSWMYISFEDLKESLNDHIFAVDNRVMKFAYT